MAVTAAHYVAAFALRLTLFAFGAHHFLKDRLDFATPATAARRVREGLFYAEHGLSPYAGGAVHASPLVLEATRAILNFGGDFGLYVACAVCDVAVATCLSLSAGAFRSAALRAQATDRPRHHPDVTERTLMDPGEGEGKRSLQDTVTLLYLFNPLVVASCVSMSAAAAANLAVAIAFAAASHGQIVTAGIACAVAVSECTHLAALIVPVGLLAACGPVVPLTEPPASGASRRGVMFALSLVWASALLVWAAIAYAGGTWDAIDATHGFALRVDDLTPNVGVFWYFFVEMFEHFRLFFLGVFHFHVLIYAALLSPALRKHPLFLCFVVLGLVATFKPYTAVVDIAFYASWLPIFAHLFLYTRALFVACNIMLFGGMLCPSFLYLWLSTTAGNANFFYAATLLVALANFLVLSDAVYAVLRRDWDLLNGPLTPKGWRVMLSAS